ncbi:MAG: HAMP domain-containing histidine kinase [Ruminococcus sp.]|nr:HAMP domain-containing histidine kinase [Ruminococcus sp.]
MDKVNKRTLAAALTGYLIPCLIVCSVGNITLEALLNYITDWCASVIYSYDNPSQAASVERIYRLLRYVNIILIPLWSAVCLWVTVRLYCRREIAQPVDTLMKASDRILDEDLDFRVEDSTDNELGRLCGSFENMRRNLYDSNYSLWKALEERKRLNSAFSHDLRTPITVLNGYMELIQNCGGDLSPEKQAEIMTKMSGQIDRLKNYTEKMNSIHKLEDIIPDVKEVTFGKICEQLSESGILLCGEDVFSFTSDGDEDKVINTDPELLMEIFLNLASNAQHYTNTCVRCSAKLSGENLRITVSDDGSGFSEEAMRKAWKPFYRDENEEDKNHFGLGLYICWLLSRKLGGSITIENNNDGGGMVTAEITSSGRI